MESLIYNRLSDMASGNMALFLLNSKNKNAVSEIFRSRRFIFYQTEASWAADFGLPGV